MVDERRDFFGKTMSIKFNITDDELRNLYEQGISAYELAKRYNVHKATVLKRLHKFPDWDELKWKHHGLKIKKKMQGKLFYGVCEGCNKSFTCNKKRNYCSDTCYKSIWQKEWRSQNKDEINRKKRERSKMKEKKKTERQLWLEKFTQKAGEVHKRNLDRFAKKMLSKCDSWKNGLVSRSKKYNVECNVTVEELRQLLYNSYGTQCKYCNKKIDVNTLVIDHIIPISKGGTSNIDNLQIICSTSNSMKGSLDENNFKLLLEWLSTVPEELKKDVYIRLARGIH